MNYFIREMQSDDIAKVQHVAKTSWNSTYEGIIPHETQEKFLQVAYSDENMTRRLVGSLLIVAEVAGEIIGFANFSPVDETRKAELGAIYLLKEFQGNGIGTALLNEGIKQLTDVKEVFINVEKDNQIGLNFYLAKGFEVVSEFDDNFDGHILKTIRMVLAV